MTKRIRVHDQTIRSGTLTVSPPFSSSNELMNRAFATADKLTQPALWLVAALHLLFFASFLLIALSAPASAQVACTGKDLFAELKQTDPARLAKIEAKAAGTPNGESVLWRVEKDGLSPSWLFGTIHMTDPRVTALTPEAQKSFDASDRLVIETTDVMDEARIMGELAKRPDFMMFTDGETLADQLSEADRAVLAQGLKDRGIPLASVDKMKPWMLLAAIALPACETARKSSGLKILDVKLAKDAEASGKQVVGLESGIEQLEALASLPMEFHVKGLIDTLKLGPGADDMVETMISIYRDGRTNLFWPLFEEMLGDGESLGEGYADFEQTIIIKRNHTMADRAEPVLTQGGVFMAVGALHLPGEEGVVALLRNKGYTLTPVLQK